MWHCWIVAQDIKLLRVGFIPSTPTPHIAATPMPICSAYLVLAPGGRTRSRGCPSTAGIAGIGCCLGYDRNSIRHHHLLYTASDADCGYI
jgi:hypothetical protein